MDRLSSRTRRLVWLSLGVVVIAVLGIKGWQDGRFARRAPLELGGEPALLFFNNDDGCECVLVIYQRADAQIAAWSAADRRAVPIHRINLERRPDLADHYDILRAPTLMLVDSQGAEIWRQDEVVGDKHIFDLERFEIEIEALWETDPNLP